MPATIPLIENKMRPVVMYVLRKQVSTCRATISTGQRKRNVKPLRSGEVKLTYYLLYKVYDSPSWT